MSFYRWAALFHLSHKPSSQNAKSQERKEIQSLEDITEQESIGVLNPLSLYSMSEIFGEILYPDENSNAQFQQSVATFCGRRYSIFLSFFGPAKAGFLYEIFLKLRGVMKFTDCLRVNFDIDFNTRVNQNDQIDANSIFANTDLENAKILSSSQEPRILPHTKAILEKS